MNKIKCNFYNYNKKTFREVQVDTNFKVYPCCVYLIDYRNRRVDKHDPFLKLNTTLEFSKMEDIINSFKEIFNEEVWSDKNKCPSQCRDCEITKRQGEKCDYKL